jgi:hypothetical protein
MNWKRWLSGMALSAVMLMGLPIAAQAADYGFTTAAPQDFYKSGSYEEVYGSQYNYGGKNVVDYQIPELEYGLFSATQTGVMERTTLPGLQAAVATGDGTGGSGYGVSGGGGPITVLTEAGTGSGGATAFLPPTSVSQPSTSQNVTQKPTYTSVEGMKRSDAPSVHPGSGGAGDARHRQPGGRGAVYPGSERAGLFPGGIRMIDTKNELRYILLTRLLEKAAAGLLTLEELCAAKRLARDKYHPQTVWE